MQPKKKISAPHHIISHSALSGLPRCKQCWRQYVRPTPTRWRSMPQRFVSPPLLLFSSSRLLLFSSSPLLVFSSSRLLLFSSSPLRSCSLSPLNFSNFFDFPLSRFTLFSLIFYCNLSFLCADKRNAVADLRIRGRAGACERTNSSLHAQRWRLMLWRTCCSPS